ncbi:hypothetical protein [Rhodopirellula sp. SWK7]|uniref:hypothetical protein n=1 Tax=Rhodopirellula sp. SWK7 TaxID=595460 RepID=UPI0002BD780E|nr:hypothetical protein [Rhodopirellula sp. SWK7]EMI40254.1 hypothetical protein RRSWK_07214 [Rhodopirellula sp. SWK7]
MTQSPYDFQPLLEGFAETRDSVHSQSERRFDPNDFARHGFSLTAPDSAWASDHQQVIDARCAGDLSEESLADHGTAAPAWRAFTCLALGCLLGLYQSQQIDDQQFFVADAQLAGFMFLHSPLFETF